VTAKGRGWDHRAELPLPQSRACLCVETINLVRLGDDEDGVLVPASNSDVEGLGVSLSGIGRLEAGIELQPRAPALLISGSTYAPSRVA